MDDQALFAIGEVSAIVGLSRHTIRAWERRHGFRPRRTQGGQRRYTPEDIALLREVKCLSARHGTSLKLAFGTAQGDLRLASEEPDSSPGIWRCVADMLPEPIVVLEPRGLVCASNRAASAALGRRADELCGRHLAELLERGPGRQRVPELLGRARAGRTRFELDLVTISGTCRWSFDARPCMHEGQPYLVLVGGPAVSSRHAARSGPPERPATARPW